MSNELSEADTQRAWELADRMIQAIARGDVPKDLTWSEYARLLYALNWGYQFEGELTEDTDNE